MAEGTIKRLTDKGFGFIDTGSDKDMFFHSSNVEGVSYEELQEGQRVSYTEGHGPKGPRAENVRIWPLIAVCDSPDTGSERRSILPLGATTACPRCHDVPSKPE